MGESEEGDGGKGEEGDGGGGEKGNRGEGEEGGGERVRREVGEGVKREVGEGVMERGRKYEPGWLGGERAAAVAEGAIVTRRKTESDSYQRRLFSDKPSKPLTINQGRGNRHPSPDTREKIPPPIRLQGQTGRGQRSQRIGPWNHVPGDEGFPRSHVFEVSLGGFDSETYQAGQRLEDGENEMRKFQFNQRESENTQYDRELKDVRNPRYSV